MPIYVNEKQSLYFLIIWKFQLPSMQFCVQISLVHNNAFLFQEWAWVCKTGSVLFLHSSWGPHASVDMSEAAEEK